MWGDTKLQAPALSGSSCTHVKDEAPGNLLTNHREGHETRDLINQIDPERQPPREGGMESGICSSLRVTEKSSE